MQANESEKLHVSSVNTEHIAIRRKLKLGGFNYYDETQKKWRPITNFAEPDCDKDSILVHCNRARQNLTLPYPLQLDLGVCYLWGLISGANDVSLITGDSRYTRQCEIRVDANQEPIIQSIADRLGVSIQITPLKRIRRRKGAKRPPSRYRKILVKFPLIFKKFLLSLGYKTNLFSYPNWLSMDQKISWFEGYLNSKKLWCRITDFSEHGTKLFPRVHIYIIQNDPHLLRDITSLLDHFSIEYSIRDWQGRLQVVIWGRSSISELMKSFTIRRPKARALTAIIQELYIQPVFRVALQKFKLNEFQMLLYGLILDQPPQENEYTLFEEILTSSSNEVRQELYTLDKLGLITYYKKENNKEFVVRNLQYFHHIQRIIRNEEVELRRLLKLTNSNALSFCCQGCKHIFGYTEVMGENSFQCPHCSSYDLTPISISKFFYCGPLASLSHQRNIIQNQVEVTQKC